MDPVADLLSKKQQRLKMRHDLAVCIYFASYLSPRNSSSRAFVRGLQDPHLSAFFKRLDDE